ncbi:MAG: hypothetical protein ACYDDF_00735 [Thermoplasmatota archaeon]
MQAGTMIFRATCPQCGVDGKFIEFKVVPCGPHAEAEKREYGFRCLKCKATLPSIADAAGARHEWFQGKHVVA